MSYCGVRDWRPSRISGLTSSYSADDVRRAARCLEARHFIVTDDDTEEVLLRSWVRFDGLMRQWRLAVSFVNAYTDTASDTLRRVIVHEAKKLQRARAEPAVLGRQPAGRSPHSPVHLGEGFAPRFGPVWG